MYVSRYTNARGLSGVPLNQVRQIDVKPGTQPCDTMAVHPSFSLLEQLWKDGDASFTANVGALVEPLTKQQFLERKGQTPAALFSHNIQTQGSKTLTPQTTTGKTGILGRIFQAFDNQAAAKGNGERPCGVLGYRPLGVTGRFCVSDRRFRAVCRGVGCVACGTGSWTCVYTV